MRKLLIPAIVALGLLVSACTQGQIAATEAAIAAAQTVKDTEANTLKASVCAISIGANNRVNSPQERAALDVLCFGSKSETVTTDDVLMLRKLMGLVDAVRPAPPAPVATFELPLDEGAPN